MAEAKKNSAFLMAFVPGLVLGLVVGALAAAFIAPRLENRGPSVDMPDSIPRKPPMTPEERLKAEMPSSESIPPAPTPPDAVAPAPDPAKPGETVPPAPPK